MSANCFSFCKTSSPDFLLGHRLVLTGGLKHPDPLVYSSQMKTSILTRNNKLTMMRKPLVQTTRIHLHLKRPVHVDEGSREHAVLLGTSES